MSAKDFPTCNFPEYELKPRFYLFLLHPSLRRSKEVLDNWAKREFFYSNLTGNSCQCFAFVFIIRIRIFLVIKITRYPKYILNNIQSVTEEHLLKVFRYFNIEYSIFNIQVEFSFSTEFQCSIIDLSILNFNV